MASQRLNQQRLETYLSASSQPNFDNIASHMESSQPRLPHGNGTSTPRDLNTRLKLLELYTLHVLPQNEEWDYARDFINMSEVLDEERREAFVHALQSLREEKDHDALREKELAKRQEEELKHRQQEDERRLAEEAKEEAERRRQEAESRQRPQSSMSNGSGRDRAAASGASARPPHQTNGHGQRPPPPSSSRPPKATRKPVSPPPSVYRRASSLMTLIQSTLIGAQRSLARNPMAMLRLLLFLLAFALAFARRDVRERIRRTVGQALDRIKRTVGMGVKVSYI